MVPALGCIHPMCETEGHWGTLRMVGMSATPALVTILSQGPLEIFRVRIYIEYLYGAKLAAERAGCCYASR